MQTKESKSDQRVESLNSYLPNFITENFLNREISVDDFKPQIKKFESTILFTDISGFTNLTSLMAETGIVGIEELSVLINSYFEKLIRCIQNYGGDIVKFAGDALIAIWTTKQESKEVIYNSVSQCAKEIINNLNDYKTVKNVNLKIKVCICGGETYFSIIGGLNNKWKYFLSGESIIQLRDASIHFQSGQIIISPEIWKQAGGILRGKILPDNHMKLKTIKTIQQSRSSQNRLPKFENNQVLRPFLLSSILSRIDSGQADWMAEFRNLTVLFIGINGLQGSDLGNIENLQQVMIIIQSIIYKYGGSVFGMNMDEKGTYVISIFGLPPSAYVDNPLRGLISAKEILHKLEGLGLQSSIGVTSGRMYSGPIGNVHRRDFTVYGNEMNLCARLMQLARDNEVLCDKNTFQATKDEYYFDSVVPNKSRVKNIPKYIFRPKDKKNHSIADYKLIGRSEELKVIRNKIDELIKGQGGTILIEGEPGVGKSVLVSSLRNMGIIKEIPMIESKSDPIEKTTPYYPWRSIINSIIGFSDIIRDKDFSSIVKTLNLDQEYEHLIPLLNIILQIGMEDNEVTSQMFGQVRSDNTNDLLIQILSKKAKEDSFIVILEDSQWMDSTSWGLVHRISQEIPSILILIVTRPVSEPTPQGYNQLIDSKNFEKIVMRSMNFIESRELIKKNLNVKIISDQVVELLQSHTGGNPFFIEELIHSLKDVGKLIVRDNECQIGSDEDIGSLYLPGTIQGLITSRIDYLKPAQQLILKVASVIGKEFNFQLLHDIFPVEENKPDLINLVEELIKYNLLSKTSENQNIVFEFKNKIIQEVAYNHLLYEHRHIVHQKIAEWYESRYQKDLYKFYPLLAFHWSKASEHIEHEHPTVDRAINYLGKAGENALSSGAYYEAINLFEKVIWIDRRCFNVKKDKKRTLEQSRWQRSLSEAYLGVGDFKKGGAHFRKALRLLGWPEPRNILGFIFGIFRQIIQQFIHNLMIGSDIYISDYKRNSLIEASRSYQRLMETYWFSNNMLPLVHSGFKALNLAEKAGPSPELARAYAVMSISVGSIPIHSLAEKYRRQALVTSQKINRLHASAYAYFYPSVYGIGAGKWDQIDNDLEIAAKHFKRIGDKRFLYGDNLTVQGMSSLYQGRFKQAEKQFDKVYNKGVSNNNIQHQLWAIIGKSECLIRFGDFDKAIEFLDIGITLLKTRNDMVEYARCLSLKSMCFFRKDKYSESLENIEKTSSLLSKLWVPTSHYLLETYSSVTEIYLSLWEANMDNNHKYKVKARKAGEEFFKYAKIFPIGKPRALLWKGVYECLEGKSKKAIKTWEKSLINSTNLNMPYEKGKYYFEVGKKTFDNNTSKDCFLQAISIFDKLQAKYEANKARKLLENLS